MSPFFLQDPPPPPVRQSQAVDERWRGPPGLEDRFGAPPGMPEVIDISSRRYGNSPFYSILYVIYRDVGARIFIILSF